MTLRPLLSIAISTIGRQTLPNTLEVITRIPEFRSGEIQLAIFANAIDESLKLQYLRDFAARHPDVKVRFQGERLHMWESRRESLKLCSGDFVWPMGDDDQPVSEAIKNLIALLKIHPATPTVVTLNGYWSDYVGKTGTLPAGKSGTFSTASPASAILALNKSMNSLDLGRFIVSKDINLAWISQPGTTDETWHEEYRALYIAISTILAKGKHLRIVEAHEPIITLGRVEKSWSGSYLEARLGQIRMLSQLPSEFEPASRRLWTRELRFFSSFRHLISIRARYYPEKLDQHIIPHSTFTIAKIRLINLLPSFVIKEIRKFIT